MIGQICGNVCIICRQHQEAIQQHHQAIAEAQARQLQLQQQAHQLQQQLQLQNNHHQVSSDFCDIYDLLGKKTKFKHSSIKIFVMGSRKK